MRALYYPWTHQRYLLMQQTMFLFLQFAYSRFQHHLQLLCLGCECRDPLVSVLNSCGIQMIDSCKSKTLPNWCRQSLFPFMVVYYILVVFAYMYLIYCSAIHLIQYCCDIFTKSNAAHVFTPYVYSMYNIVNPIFDFQYLFCLVQYNS